MKFFHQRLIGSDWEATEKWCRVFFLSWLNFDPGVICRPGVYTRHHVPVCWKSCTKLSKSDRGIWIKIRPVYTLFFCSCCWGLYFNLQSRPKVYTLCFSFLLSLNWSVTSALQTEIEQVLIGLLSGLQCITPSLHVLLFQLCTKATAKTELVNWPIYKWKINLFIGDSTDIISILSIFISLEVLFVSLIFKNF